MKLKIIKPKSKKWYSYKFLNITELSYKKNEKQNTQLWNPNQTGFR